MTAAFYFAKVVKERRLREFWVRSAILGEMESVHIAAEPSHLSGEVWGVRKHASVYVDIPGSTVKAAKGVKHIRALTYMLLKAAKPWSPV